MQIRTRLTLQFLLIGGLIMISASAAIYISSESFRKADFQNRLVSKARSTARLLFEAEEIEPEKVKSIEKDNPLKLNNERIIIYNFLDDIVYSSDENSEIKIRYDQIEKVRRGDNVTFRQGRYEVVGLLYLAKLDRFVIFAAATDDEGMMHLEKLKIILVIVCFITLLILFAAGWVYSGKALKPINEVIKRVDEITVTSLNLRVPEGNGKDEIGKLAITFNRMLDRLEKAFSMQKDFLANASHELSTPLTKINGQIEVLLMKERSVPEYRKALESIHEDLRSLINLSNRLLLIARTSAEDTSGFNRRVRIDEILFQTRDEILKTKSNYRIGLFIDESLSDFNHLTVTGDENLLKIALSNIIDNACKYSPDHSVNVTLNRTERHVELIFEDKGVGIPEEDLPKVFEPFYRGSNVQSIPGSGIGLPLVYQIIRNHNGTVKIESEMAKGTKVVITLPLSN